jgi:N,N'-diacetylbacillosaminyl-diphospho-undecaprenol alpha-1,3-N-acetylgalactosaminyltransferase
MKVAVVCPDGRSVILFCRGTVVSLVAAPNTEVIVLSDLGDSRDAIEALGARCVQVPVYRFFGVYRDLRYLFHLIRIFRREKVDAVYNISTKPNIFGTIAARVSGVKRVVSHVVGLGSLMLPATSLGRRVLQFVFLRLYWVVCRLSDRVWFFNPNDLNFFLSRGLITSEKPLLTNTYLDVSYYSRGRVAAADVAAARRELNLDSGDRVVIMVARMIWPKGIQEFVEAAAQLVAKHRQWRFLLIAHTEPGNPDEVPASYVEENAERANLTWLRYRSDLRPYYSMADIAVLPSFYREGGQPRGLLEAMALGKPVITTDSLDCRYAVDPGVNGYWVPVRDATALANAIERVMLDDAELQRFGERSRARALELFDEKKIVAHALAELGFIASADG